MRFDMTMTERDAAVVDRVATWAAVTARNMEATSCAPRVYIERRFAGVKVAAVTSHADSCVPGDPDPTVVEGPTCCEATDGTHECTRAPGHQGQHVAGTGMRVTAVWREGTTS